ncbi:hypothetical protein GCWU000324_01420 [Kingella oralis ATCC 51147]|uniref:Uncharacterized protein n=1 Tax=Kingella oralis ATCC 51147 TaxID=629741 RepID=C4GH01_9NEIS|nr:hypothetical protein GCWU000324_01420 [Kingella oralis ATCC 51147]
MLIYAKGAILAYFRGVTSNSIGSLKPAIAAICKTSGAIK